MIGEYISYEPSLHRELDTHTFDIPRLTHTSLVTDPCNLIHRIKQESLICIQLVDHYSELMKNFL